MKKILFALVAIGLLVFLVACQSNNAGSQVDDDSMIEGSDSMVDDSVMEENDSMMEKDNSVMEENDSMMENDQ